MKGTIFFVVLIILTIITICFSYRQRSKLEDKLWTINSNLLETRFELDDMRAKTIVCYSTNGVTLPDSIASLLSDSVYILRLHNNICMSCYAEHLIRLKEKLNMTKQQLYVLGSYIYDDALRDEISILTDSNLRVINIPALEIMPADSMEIPYIFLLNPRNKLEYVHFFEKHDFTITEEYLKSNLRMRN